MKIFVYGTLKRSGCRRHVLLHQNFLGEAATLATYQLFSLGDYPGLVECKPTAVTTQQGFSIQGELYEVDDDCKRQLDAIESVDEGLYELRPIKLMPPFDCVEAFAYFYQLSVDGCPDCGVSW